jgi:membrane-associated protease RseP (regulator of RpoE activity)
MLILAAGAFVAIYTGTFRTVAVVLSLIIMIVLHEAGHMVTAKWSHMKVTEFFVGFGPRLWSIRRGETEYGVKALWLGGYVKIIGMNNLEQVDPADEPRTYRQKSYPRRLSVAVAGSTVHFLLAFVLFFITFAAVGAPFWPAEVGGVVPEVAGQPSPAAQAGLQKGDRIVSIDGRVFGDWRDVPPYVANRPGEELKFVVERGGDRLELTVVPVLADRVEVRGRVIESGERGFVGIEEPTVRFRRVNPIVAIGRSADGVVTYAWGTLQAMGHIFSPSGISAYFSGLTGSTADGGGGEESDVRFLSPVGFARIASQAARAGIFEVLQLLVLINVFVGIFNMVPLLPLDGGHVAIATYEAIRSRISGKRHVVDVARLLPATYLVLLIIVFIGATSLYLDVVDPLANPFE